MGTLKAKVNGVWTPIAGNPQASADLARWNSAWGVLGRQTLTSTFTTTGTHTNFQATGMSLPITETAGRMLRITVVDAPYPSGGLQPIYFQLWRNGVAVDQWYISDASTFIGSSMSVSHVSTVAATGGAATYSVVIRGATANTAVSDYGDANSVRVFTIEDAGPVTPAAIAPPAATPRVVASGNALGVIAVGSFPPPLAPVSVAASTTTVITNALSFFAAVGRRYRINFQLRAIQNTAGAGTISFNLRDNGNQYPGWQPGGDPYVWLAGSYQSVNLQWYLEGDNLLHSIDAVVVPSVACNIFRDYGIFNIEDVGPNSSPALPISETPMPWTQVTAFQNGWQNYGLGWTLAAYRKIGDEVALRGLIRNGTLPAVAFNLPVGFRPLGGVGGSGTGHHFAVDSMGAFGEIRVTADGDVRMGAGNNGWFDLAQIRFSTTA